MPRAQARGVAALVQNDTRIAGRVRADGVHIDTGLADLAAAVEKLRPKLIVGAGGLRSRHEAMTAGEANPDYLFFGRLDGDNEDDVFEQGARPRRLVVVGLRDPGDRDGRADDRLGRDGGARGNRVRRPVPRRLRRPARSGRGGGGGQPPSRPHGGDRGMSRILEGLAALALSAAAAAAQIVLTPDAQQLPPRCRHRAHRRPWPSRHRRPTRQRAL